jgi:hypothetical protein
LAVALEEVDNSSRNQSEDQFKLSETSEDKEVELVVLEYRETQELLRLEEFQEVLPLKVQRSLRNPNNSNQLDLKDLRSEI